MAQICLTQYLLERIWFHIENRQASNNSKILYPADEQEDMFILPSVQCYRNPTIIPL